MLPSFPKELTSENEAYSCGQVGFWLPSGRWTTQPGTAGRGSRDTEEVRPEERGGLVITEGRARPAEWAGGEQNPFFIPNHQERTSPPPWRSVPQGQALPPQRR